MALFYSRVSVRHTVVTVIQHAQCLKLKQRHSFYYLHLHLSYCDMSKCLLWKRLAWPVGIVGLCTYGQVHNEISRTKSGVCAALWFWQWKECVWLCISVLWVHIKSMYCISISDFFASGPWGLKATLNSRQAASKLDVSWPTHTDVSPFTIPCGTVSWMTSERVAWRRFDANFMSTPCQSYIEAFYNLCQRPVFLWRLVPARYSVRHRNGVVEAYF